MKYTYEEFKNHLESTLYWAAMDEIDVDGNAYNDVIKHAKACYDKFGYITEEVMAEVSELD